MSRLSIPILVASTGFLLAAPVLAAEQTVQNDSAPPDTPCNCLIAGESTAAWLTATCSGNIVAVQARWRSQIGSSPSQIEHSISVFGAGSFPTPGAALQNAGAVPAVVLGPTLVDGIVNEFRFLDPPTNAVPLSVPVTSGQSFVVALKFLNTSSGGAPFAPDIVYDSDGCQPNLNSVDVMPGGWADACPLGVTGDWALRAVIACAPKTPATSSWGAASLVALLVTGGAMLLAYRLRNAL